MKVKSESDVAQSCPTPSDPMDGSLSGFSVHGIFQARVLEGVAVAFSVDSITDSKEMNSSKLWEIVKYREAWSAAVHKVAKRRQSNSNST